MPELPCIPDDRLTTVRAHFGLSQREAAHLLGTTQGRINDAEAGRRQLLYPAALRLRALHALVEAAPTAPPPPTAEEADSLGLALKRLAKCRYVADRLVHHLGELPARAASARQRLAASATVLTALAPADVTDPLPPNRLGAQHAQWALLLSTARQELFDTSGQGPTLLAQARLAGLRAEAAVLAAALEA